MLEAGVTTSTEDSPPAAKVIRQRNPDGEAPFSVSSRAKDIYANYQDRHQRIRARMIRLNLHAAALASARAATSTAPCTSSTAVPDCPSFPSAVASTRRLNCIRYANSAPEISNDSTDASTGPGFCSCAAHPSMDTSFEHVDDADLTEVDSAMNDDLINDDSNEAEEEEMPVRRGPTKNLIQELIEVDRLETLVNLKGLQVRGGGFNATETAAASGRLSRIGDEIVEKLVDWTKLLPFYNDLPVEVHTQMLTQKWSELVLLSACFYATSTIHSSNIEKPSFTNSSANVFLFQRRLSAVMNKYIPIDNVVKEAGLLIQKFTALLETFSKLNMTIEAYVCLKSIALVHGTTPEIGSPEFSSASIMSIYSRKVQIIEDQFVKALQIHLSQCEAGPRLSEILNFLPVLTSTAQTLLASKMFYVPFLICREPDQYSPPLGALAEVVAALSERGIAIPPPAMNARAVSPTHESEDNCTSSSISDGGHPDTEFS
uniref:NR LBD domain-containing protein n=1 Tax=Panagrellus redivivus TaxID=6233 RepID=A0A7E4WBD0_PANRE